MKIIGMIPARLGSTRVKNKNLRYLDNVPLIQHIINAAKNSKYLDDIYINSEAEIFKDIAESNGIKFYKRSEKLVLDSAMNDDFALDFINKIECDVLIQLLATSPFVSTKEIDRFIESMLDGKFETMISISNIQIECVYKNKPINFKQKEQTPPSQLLEPIKPYACSLMGWDTNRFRKNIDKYNAAYHGGDGSVGFFELRGYSKVDIDDEEDFIIAEAIVEAIKKPPKPPQYFNIQENQKNKKQATNEEADVESILIKDGVLNNDLYDVNKELTNVKEILKDLPKDSSWSKRIIDNESNSMTIIGQMPGEGNRRHFHTDWNEWWYILEGEWDWEIDGETKTVKQGDIVFMRKNRVHKITASGDKQAIRFAISRSDVVHTYVDSE